MKIYSVSVISNYKQKTEHTRVLADCEESAMRKGIKKLYGKHAYLWQNCGLPRGYGQIVEPLNDRSSTRVCLTGEIRVEVGV